MSTWVLSRYNHDISWIDEYTDDFILYDRSEKPQPGSIIMSNIGSDWYDKLTYIIDNYEDLPDTIILIKANLFKYISKKEFDRVQYNQCFTPLFTQHHKVYEPICRYNNGMYEEINNRWYLRSHPAKKADKLMDMLGIKNKEYVQFAPGSNYIITREVIHRKSKGFYSILRKYLEWDVYPGEAQIIERGIYNIWS